MKRKGLGKLIDKLKGKKSSKTKEEHVPEKNEFQKRQEALKAKWGAFKKKPGNDLSKAIESTEQKKGISQKTEAQKRQELLKKKSDDFKKRPGNDLSRNDKKK